MLQCFRIQNYYSTTEHRTTPLQRHSAAVLQCRRSSAEPQRPRYSTQVLHCYYASAELQRHSPTALQTTALQYQTQCYSTTALQYYSTTVLQYYSTTVLQYYSTQYYSTTVPQYYSTAVLQYYSTTLLLLLPQGRSEYRRV